MRSDIQGYDLADVSPCVELDLLEGNVKAVQSTLHTAQGKGEDGRCNQDGCVGNWGRHAETAHSYGSDKNDPDTPHAIDSGRPIVNGQ